MTVTADYFDSKLSKAICDMLAACASWSGSIVEDWGGLEAPFKDRAGADVVTTARWAIVRVGSIESQQIAADTIARSGSATILISEPLTAGDSPAESMRRARNLTGTLCDELRAQLGGAGALMWADFSPQPPTLGAEMGAGENNTETAIEVAWREIP